MSTALKITSHKAAKGIMTRSRLHRFIALSTILITTLGYHRYLFSWSFFELFMDQEYSEESLEKVHEFNPDEDILYLPKLENKEFFKSLRDLSVSRRNCVRKYTYIYLTTGRPYTLRAIERSHHYLPIIREVMEKEYPDLPEELALLPLLESGFNPFAVSRSNAVGLWQFMYNTSTALGLKTNRWVEERRDIEKSTRAALRHLNNHYKTFGSWELALAAYNGGGGAVRRGMQRSGATDYWELRESGTISEETSEYVAKYAALVLIYRNQELFQVHDEIPAQDDIALDSIALKYPVTLNTLMSTGDIDRDTLYRYNPQLRQHITPPAEKDYLIRLPQEMIDKLRTKEESLYKYRFSGLRPYRVKQGDTLSSIAARFKKKLLLS